MDTLRCPILRTLMRRPVIAADGHTYERRAILLWFEVIILFVCDEKNEDINWLIKKNEDIIKIIIINQFKILINPPLSAMIPLHSLEKKLSQRK